MKMRGPQRGCAWRMTRAESGGGCAEVDSRNQQEEFADVFAWLCTLANITDVDLETACEKYTGDDIKGFKPK